MPNLFSDLISIGTDLFGGGKSTGPLTSLFNDTIYPASLLTFPHDLASHGHFALFTPIGYDRQNKFDKGRRSPGSAISLPIPANLGTAYNAQWGQEEMGVMGNEIANIVGDLANKEKLTFDGIKSRLSQPDTINSLITRGAINSVEGITGALKSFTGLNADAITSSTLKVATNPHIAMIFRGVSFRTYGFGYRMVARNANESETIRYIVNSFKKHMHPSVGRQVGSSNVTLDVFNYPDQWQIEFFTPDNTRNKYLFQPAISVLTGFSVDFGTDGGTPAFFDSTNAPVTVTISLAFTETEIVTRERIENDNF